MEQPFVVVAVDSLSAIEIDRIRAALDGWATMVRLPQSPGPTQLAEYHRANVIVGWPEPDAIRDSVRVIQLPASGWNRYAQLGASRVSDLTICNARGVYGVAVAEHVIALMLSVVRRLRPALAANPDTFWSTQRNDQEELTGSTACIVGVGDIGTEVARRCLGLGMNVVGVRRDLLPIHPLVERVYELSQIKAAVGDADHVICCVPLAADSRQLFGAELFGSMKPGSFFYNVSRGGLVDESALISALDAGRLGGAALDVFADEPLPPESPLWQASNLIITPHVAGRSTGISGRLTQLIVTNVDRLRAGQPLENVVSGPTRPGL